MKFDSRWQPLKDEDAQTALVFGFLKHAPVQLALDPWLTAVLGRPASGQPLTRASFWPRYPANDGNGIYTEPDLAFEANDGEPLLILVEAKPAYGQHGVEQLAREVVDATLHLTPARIAVVPVGADLSAPSDLPLWQAVAVDRLHAAGSAGVAVEFHYSSWNDLARTIHHVGALDESWRAYADDVLFRLRAKGVLDYEGAPMINDLDGLTLSNAVEVYHRIIRAFRTLALTVHHQGAIGELELEPYEGNHALLRDGRSLGLPGAPSLFETTILLIAYRAPHWPDGCGTFFSAWLTGEDGPCLQVGAFETRAVRGDLPWGFAEADMVDDVDSSRITRAQRNVLEHMAASRNTDWLYAEQPWTPGDGADDVQWVLAGLTAATDVWGYQGPDLMDLTDARLPG